MTGRPVDPPVQLRHWARMRHVYGTRYGFPGGSAWLVMLLVYCRWYDKSLLHPHNDGCTVQDVLLNPQPPSVLRRRVGTLAFPAGRGDVALALALHHRESPYTGRTQGGEAGSPPCSRAGRVICWRGVGCSRAPWDAAWPPPLWCHCPAQTTQDTTPGESDWVGDPGI